MQNNVVIESLPPNVKSAALSIVQKIKTGVYKPNQNIPSVRKLSEMLDINRHSTWQALKALEDSKWITPKKNGRYQLSKSVQDKIFQNLKVAMITAGKNCINFAGHQELFFRLRKCLKELDIEIELYLYHPDKEMPTERILQADVMLVVGGIQDYYKKLKDIPANVIGINVDFALKSPYIINPDSFESGQEAAKYAAKKNVKKAVVVGFRDHTSWTHTELRFQGFEHIWMKSGNPPENLSRIILNGNHNRILEMLDLQKFVEKHKDADLFFCIDEKTSIGVANCLEILKIKIPKKAKIIGYDILDINNCSHKSISGFEQDFATMADETITLIQNLSEQRDLEKTIIKVPLILVHRETS